MSRTHLLAVTLCLALFGGCTSDDPGPVADRTFSTPALEQAWEILDLFLVFRDQLPADPYAFATPQSMYRAVEEPWTIYYTNVQAVSLFASLSTSRVGMGVYFDSVASGVVLRDVFPGSPAAAAGLQRRDTIVSVNGYQCAGQPLDSVGAHISGTVGQTRTIEYRRGASTYATVVILATYSAPSVFVDTLDTATAYIALEGFYNETNTPGGSAEEIREALRATMWARATILDLRYNGGGYITQCLRICGEFVPAGTRVIHATERDVYMQVSGGDTSVASETIDTVWTTETAGIALDRRMWVLMNEWSASASEILISCIHDNRPDIATVGATTYGKARGQVLIGLSDDGEYFLPDQGVARVTYSVLQPIVGPSYDETGIVPRTAVAQGQDALTVARQQIAATLGKRVDGAVYRPRGERTQRVEPILIDDRR